MNCKPGDLAIVVRSYAGNEGKIVRCLRINEIRSRMLNISVTGEIEPPAPIWDIDQLLRADDDNLVDYVRDSQLRPIRDPGDDAVDETLLRIPSPRQEVTA